MLRVPKLVIADCPLEFNIPLDDCKKCPYHKRYTMRGVQCEMLSERERKMQAEPAKITEPVSRW